MGEKRIVSRIQQGMSDMMPSAIVIVFARGVAVIMNNTQTPDTVPNNMERLVSGASGGVFSILVTIVHIPLALLIPSSSGHATLAMPILAALAGLAGVPRAMTLTACRMGHGLTLLVAPTDVVVVGGLAIAGVADDRNVRSVGPLLAANSVVVCVALLIGVGVS